MEVGGERQYPSSLPLGKRPGTHCTGGWLGPRAGLDGCGNSRPHRHSIPRPSSESLYRLHDPSQPHKITGSWTLQLLKRQHVRCTVRRRDAGRRAMIVIMTRLHSVRSRVTIAAREVDFHLLQDVCAGSGAHPDSYSVLIGSHFLGIKRSGWEVDLSRPPFVHPLLGLRMNWAILRFLMCLYGLHRDNYAFWPFAYWEAWDSMLFIFHRCFPFCSFLHHTVVTSTLGAKYLLNNQQQYERPSLTLIQEL